MDMVVIMVLIASCLFSVAVNEYSDSVGECWVRVSLAAVAWVGLFFFRLRVERAPGYIAGLVYRC